MPCNHRPPALTATLLPDRPPNCSNEDAVALVRDTVKHPGMCAQRLAVEALARGGGDNVAVAVIFLPGHGTTGACRGRAEHGKAGYGSRGTRAVVRAILAARCCSVA